MSIYLYIDALFVFVAHLAAEKSMSNLTGLHTIFRKISTYGLNMGFHALTGHCAHQTCLQLNMCRNLWKEGSTHNTGNKNPLG